MKTTTIEGVFAQVYEAVARRLHEDAEVHYRLFEEGIQIVVRVPEFGAKMEDCYTSATVAWKTLTESVGETHPLAAAIVDMCRQTNIGLGKVRYMEWTHGIDIFMEAFPDWDDLPEAAKNPWMAKPFDLEQADEITRAVVGS